jgi:hypothetical protein
MNFQRRLSRAITLLHSSSVLMESHDSVAVLNSRWGSVIHLDDSSIFLFDINITLFLLSWHLEPYFWLNSHPPSLARTVDVISKVTVSNILPL